MAQEATLAAALEREHRDIDGGIEEYSTALERGEGDPEPLLRAMRGLRRHIYLEETFLFPPLKAAGMMMPIFVMLREHGELWDQMAGLDDTLASDSDAGTLLDACRALLAQLDAHNSKEEPVIYSRADAVLGAEATGELKEFLDGGTTPEGWACAKATMR